MKKSSKTGKKKIDFPNGKVIFAFFVFLVIVIGATKYVFLSRPSVMSASATTALNLFFDTTVYKAGQLPHEFQLQIDTKDKSVVFIKTQINYGAYRKIQLTKQPMPSGPFTRVIYLTPLETANRTGIMDIILATDPGKTSLPGVNNIVSLSFGRNNTDQDLQIPISTSKTQLVLENGEELPAVGSTLNINY